MSTDKCLMIIFSLTLTACAPTRLPTASQGTDVVTKDAYARSRETNGIVLMDINWGRKLGCGGHDNAQIITLAFDRLPLASFEDDADATFVINTPSRLFVDPVFVNHAYSLEPGEYALSAFMIKIADSPPVGVRFHNALRSQLYKNGKPIGGTFVVNPGEAVFIGNFYLDCTYEPTLWRYYPEGRDNFETMLSEYRESFPFLELEDVQYRLFKTSLFGYDYELEAQPNDVP